MGTRVVQVDTGSDSDSESRHRSPRRLPAGWDRRVEDDYRRWLQTTRNNGTDKTLFFFLLLQKVFT
jgi:hypothetical protein